MNTAQAHRTEKPGFLQIERGSAAGMLRLWQASHASQALLRFATIGGTQPIPA